MGKRLVGKSSRAEIEARMAQMPSYVPKAVRRARAEMGADAPRVTEPFWQVRNADAAEAEILLYDQIGFDWFGDGVTAASFARDLASIKAKRLVVRVNSPGGDVFDGLAIKNLLEDFPGTVEARIDGLAASIASVIIMAADTIVAGRHSQIMIHDASGFAMGNAADMVEMAELLDMISDNIAQVYADRVPGTSAKTWRATMKGERWYTAEEAVEAGLVTRVAAARNAGTMPCPECDGTGEEGGKTCPMCEGSGTVPESGEADDAATCDACDGAGTVECKSCKGSGTKNAKCKVCDGTGKVTCDKCGGNGKPKNAAGGECSTCDGTGKIRGGKVTCPDCDGSGKAANSAADLGDALSEAVRRAYRFDDLRPTGGVVKPGEPSPTPGQPEIIVNIETSDDGERLSDLIKNSLKTVKVPSLRDIFAGLAEDMPEGKPDAPKPVDLGPLPVRSEPEPQPSNLLADAVRAALGTASVNQPEAPPAAPAPVDLGPAPVLPAPEPEEPRNPLAEAVAAAVSFAATHQPEPETAPSPEPEEHAPTLRLDVKDLRRAVTESRF